MTPESLPPEPLPPPDVPGDPAADMPDDPDAVLSAGGPALPPAAAPTATYRLQIQPAFPFAAAEAAVPYIASLGISHLHLSPVLEAVPGSEHGYDVVDHTAIRAELGGERGLRRLSATARDYGLGLILDIVPNHMAVPAPERLNRALWEVLRDGPGSPYAHWFDIDWEAGGGPGGRVLLPVLGGRLGEELEHFRLERDTPEQDRPGSPEGPGHVLRYYDHVFPVRPGTERLPLPELIDAQWYRPAWWRLARTELNYRRFFTISDLIGVRVQEPAVFAATHETVLRMLREGVVEGLRVDHPDGLADPEAYLRRLAEATGGCWTVVEKILTGSEPLPRSWPVAGTTGYDALRRIDGLFVDPAGAHELAAHYREFTRAPADLGGVWPDTASRAAREVVTHELAAEVEALGRIADRICRSTPALRDHAPWALRTAIRELLLRMPVYRPYAVAGEPAAERDAAMLAAAAEGARTAFTVPEEAGTVVLVRDLAAGAAGDSPGHKAFCARFAQTSSALRAKSVEDTAFYRYTPLLSAGEVGGEPAEPAVTPAAFHSFCAAVQRTRPETGTVLSTHDTKRSADVRARIAVLSQAPQEWAELLERLAKEPGRAPDPHTAWTAWQTAFGLGLGLGTGTGTGTGTGSRPGTGADAGEDGGADAGEDGGLSAGRLAPALLKAAREAGLRTSWTEPDPAYEEAVAAFAEAGPGSTPPGAATRLARSLAPHARANILGAALVQLTMPGVPDVYQGTEHEYRALVDPDNRAPFRPAPEALAGLDEGRPPRNLTEEKLRLTAAALRLRREHPHWFGSSGTYEPLRAEGPAADHCVAFGRSGALITIVTRLSRRLEQAGGWRDTRLPLPPGTWRDRLGSGEWEGTVRLSDLLAPWPVALLTPR